MSDIDPGSNALTAALAWLQGTLLGTVATTVAIVAVAAVGFLMLTGRIDVRRAAQVVLGCFIIFGASTIAGGIIGALQGGDGEPATARAAPPPPALPPPAALQQASQSPYDPYAGAAVPQR
ncbi:MAG TPA: TrbC/VirB2 family protein [Sphingomicrobium sp.]|nr:TrbC/VirB2 family protein [Sphingomicrobium sp.]